MKVASGWSLKRITLWGDFKSSDEKRVKNGFRLPSDNSIQSVELLLKNKKTGVTEEIEVFSRAYVSSEDV